MEMGRIRRQRLVDRDRGRQLLVGDVHQRHRLVRDRECLRRDGHHRFAHEADPVDGQDGAVLEGMPVVGICRGQRLPGHDGDHARYRRGASGVDADDTRVCVGARRSRP